MTADPLREAAAAINRDGVGPLDIITRLHKDTPRDEIKTREGPRGKQLSYVDARYVMDVLDDAVGPDNWQRDHRLGEGGKVSCGIGIRIDGVWIWKWDGAGETDIQGEKGSYSDSFKRAGVNWGIARDLYSQESPAPVQRPQAVPPRVATPIYERGDDEDSAAMDDDQGHCPDHDLPWVLKPGGVSKRTGNPYDPFYACASTSRPYCNNKPPRAWLARQETA